MWSLQSKIDENWYEVASCINISCIQSTTIILPRNPTVQHYLSDIRWTILQNSIWHSVPTSATHQKRLVIILNNKPIPSLQTEGLQLGTCTQFWRWVLLQTHPTLPTWFSCYFHRPQGIDLLLDGLYLWSWFWVWVDDIPCLFSWLLELLQADLLQNLACYPTVLWWGK